MAFYCRKPTRIPGYDYSKCNYYFITICTNEKECIFGSPRNLHAFGNIVKEHIEEMESHYTSVKVDKFVVMPNHVHMIMILEAADSNPSISSIIALFKTGVTKQIRLQRPDIKVWQRSFHDHIIRNQNSYEKIWNYIDNNPLKWEEDCFYVR